MSWRVATLFMIFMPVKHKKYEKYYDVEASKQKEYKYLMKVCTQIITGIVNYVQFITEQIIVLFLVKVRWCKLGSNLETTKPKEARISSKVILKRHNLRLLLWPLIMRHKLDASFCSDDWFGTGCTNNRANCSLHVFQQANVENTTLMLNSQNQQTSLM